LDFREYLISVVIFFTYLAGTIVALICGGAVGTNIGWLVRSQMENVHTATLIVCPIVFIVLWLIHKLIVAMLGGNYRRVQLAGEYIGIFIIIAYCIYVSIR
jgi:uncharacterized membrane protein required for colicin V production